MILACCDPPRVARVTSLCVRQALRKRLHESLRIAPQEMENCNG
jgi:hypothetical protein